jgi:methyl-accepting chemotaxis protein
MRLQTRFTILLFAVVLIAMALIGGIFYMNSTKLVNEMLGEQALQIAERTRTMIDPAELEAIMVNGEENEAYHAMRATLDEAREAYGLKYLYTMRAVETNGELSYEYVVDGQPEGSEDASALGEVEPEPDNGLVALFETGKPQKGTLTYTEAYGPLLTTYVPVHDAEGKLIGAVGADYNADRIYALQESNMRNMLLIAAALLVAALVAAYGLAMLLTRPLKQLTKQVELAGQGDLTVTVDLSRKDEIGVLANAFHQTMDSLRQFIGVMQRNVKQLEHSVRLLQDSSSESKTRSERIATAMQEAAAGAEIQIQRSNESSKSLEDVAAGVGRIAEASGEVAESSSQSREEAEKGSAYVQNVVNQMLTIRGSNEQLRQVVAAMNAHSQAIDQVVVTIAAIASQTNILALNAGIEAARAGEHGRGFSIVASEIRKLAEQTAASSEQITSMIGSVQEETNRAVKMMEDAVTEVQQGEELAVRAGSAFDVILAEIRKVDEQIAEVSSASEELAASTEEVSASVAEATDIVNQSAAHYAGVAEATQVQLDRVAGINAEAETLQRMAGELSELIRRFKV